MSREKIYYEELSYIRSSAKEFAQNYPDIAGKLDLIQGISSDPQIEGLIQSFAFLSASLRKSMESQQSRVILNLIQTLYPHLIRPLPSMGILECQFDLPKVIQGFNLKKGIPLLIQYDDEICRFQTVSHLVLLPVSIIQTSYEKLNDQWFIKIRLFSLVPFENIKNDELLIYIDDAQDVWIRNILLAKDPVIAKGDDKDPKECHNAIHRFGFEKDDIAFPVLHQHLYAPHLLHEYHHFKKKFSFIKLVGVLKKMGTATEGDVYIPVFNSKDTMSQTIHGHSFRLHCIPIINLFPKTTDPVRMDYTKVTYPLIPDGRHSQSTAIYHVESVSRILDETHQSEQLPYYFWPIHDPKSTLFWNTDIDEDENCFLSLVDLNFSPMHVKEQTLYAKTLCYSKKNLELVPLSTSFQIEDHTPLSNLLLVHPLIPRKKPVCDGSNLWKFVSYLNMNHQGLCESSVLNDMLSLYGGDSTISIESEPIVKRYHCAKVWKGFMEGERFRIHAKKNDFLLCLVLFHYAQLIKPYDSFLDMIFDDGGYLAEK
jgi:type VI secretion system protein ImpG